MLFLAAQAAWGDEAWQSVIAPSQHIPLAIMTYVVMGLSAASLLSGSNLPRLAFMQVAADGVIITALVLETGGANSLFASLYVLSVVASAYLMDRRGTLVTASIYASLVGLIGIAQGLDVIRITSETGDLAALTTGTLLKVFGFFLAAVLAGRLTEELQETGQELERQAAQTHALQQELAQVVQVIRSGLALIGPDGRLRVANPTALELFPGLHQRPVAQVIPDYESPHDGLWEVSLPRLSNEDEPRNILLARSQLEDGGSVLTMEDVTRLRQMEREVRSAERFSAVGRFAAGIAHEVRNPLTSLSGAVQMLEVSDQDLPLRRIILGEVERINRLVSNFIETSEPRPPNLRQTDIGALLTDVAEAFRRDPRYADQVDIAMELAPLETLLVDPDQLRQVLWNLLLNAAQAMPEGGTVELRLEDATDYVRINVRDQGVGIPDGELSQVFDPFYSKRAGGTGLGLATVDRVVRAHGGRIRVESAPGVGTKFVIWLPKEMPPPDPSGDPSRGE
ncbi:MAG: hypothetical protein H6739_34095 [Alphaproteobacteria bacterium]|nr:hypothetical protein [Alphaproteobacteria bacterium]